jgi:endoglucanase
MGMRIWPLCGLVVFWCALALAADSQIRLNTLGFLPDRPKQASIAAECSEFDLLRADGGERVMSGKVGPAATNADTGEKLWVADFSTLKTPGSYVLEVKGVGKSPPFRIAADVYDFPYCTVMRGMYLWRCGTAVSGTHNGQTFAHEACHLEDAWLDAVGGGHLKKDSTKGWHDAGDYNKYVVNAGFTVGVMLQAWEQFGSRLKNVSLNIPESGQPTPDFLSEVKWELDWLFTMQMDDGRVYHKVSTKGFGGFIMPEAEKTDRLFVPWGSAATADFTAMMAMAGRDFEPYDKPYAKRCRDAARKSYDYLAAHPQNVRPDQRGFSTGGYDANDASRRLWAAAELWETTGDLACLKDFEARAKAGGRKFDLTCGWGNVKNLGMHTYLLSKREGKDAALVEAIQKDLLATADQIVKTADGHGYRRPLGNRYYWGANGDVAQQAQTLMVANQVSPKAEYVNTALDTVGHLFGRNYYGRSFVTGLGHEPPLHPHDRRSGADKIADPWPGYLVGGGHPKATDWEDKQDNFRVNEIAINWNGALIYALAGFVEGKPSPEPPVKQ